MQAGMRKATSLVPCRARPPAPHPLPLLSRAPLPAFPPPPSFFFSFLSPQDEPTNYLDNDTLAALTKALQEYKGGVIAISHNAPFVEAVCNEKWTVRASGAGGALGRVRPRYAHPPLTPARPKNAAPQVADGEVLCETFKVKRSKDYFDKKRGGSSSNLLGSSTDLASMASADSAANLSSLGGSTADLAAMDFHESADKKGGGKKPPKPGKGKK